MTKGNEQLEATRSILDYTSFREYLRDLLAIEKKHGRGANLSTFAQAVGVSVSHLNMIITGSRNLTTSNIFRFGKALKLDQASFSYFESLVNFEQAKDTDEREYFAEKMTEAREISPVRPLRLASHKLFTEWFLPALFVYLVDGGCQLSEDGFDLDYEYLARTLGISPENLKKLLATLQESKILEIGPDEKVYILYDRVTSSAGQRQYMENAFRAALSRLRTDFYNKNAYFTAQTFTIPEANVAFLIRDLKQVLQKHMAAFDHEKRDCKNFVLQSCMQIFPVLEFDRVSVKRNTSESQAPASK